MTPPVSQELFLFSNNYFLLLTSIVPSSPFFDFGKHRLWVSDVYQAGSYIYFPCITSMHESDTITRFSLLKQNILCHICSSEVGNATPKHTHADIHPQYLALCLGQSAFQLVLSFLLCFVSNYSSQAVRLACCICSPQA